jgi:hypothetical protein
MVKNGENSLFQFGEFLGSMAGLVLLSVPKGKNMEVRRNSHVF